MKRLFLLAIAVCLLCSSFCTVVIAVAQQSPPALDVAKDLKLTPCDHTICFAGIEVGKSTWAEVLSTIHQRTDMQVTTLEQGEIALTFANMPVLIFEDDNCPIVTGISLDLRKKSISAGTLVRMFGPPSFSRLYYPGWSGYNTFELNYSNGLYALIVVPPMMANSALTSHLNVQTPIDSLGISKSVCGITNADLAPMSSPLPLVPWQGFTALSDRRYHPLDLQQ